MPLTRVRDPLSHTLFRTMVRAVSCPACLPECPAFFALRASWHLLLAVRTAGRMGFFSARTAHLRRRCGLSCSPWARRSAENTTGDTPNVLLHRFGNRSDHRPPTDQRQHSFRCRVAPVTRPPKTDAILHRIEYGAEHKRHHLSV